MRLTTMLLLTVLTAAAPAMAQKLERLPSRLEDLLDQALSSNPEIIVAKTRVAEAEAELRRLKLRVTQEVVSLSTARKTQESNVEASGRELARVKELVDNGTAHESQMRNAMSILVNARGELAKIESELRYACGLGLEGRKSRVRSDSLDLPSRESARTRPPRPQGLADKLRAPVKVKLEGASIEEIAATLSGAVDGFSIVLDPDIVRYFEEETFSLELEGEVPLEAALTAVHDRIDYCVFVLREYGALLTNSARAGRMIAATIPHVRRF